MKWEVFHARLNCYKLYSLRDLSQRVYNSKRFKSVFVLFYFHLVDPMPPLPSLMCASRPSRRELNKRLIHVTVAHQGLFNSSSGALSLTQISTFFSQGSSEAKRGVGIEKVDKNCELEQTEKKSVWTTQSTFPLWPTVLPGTL